MLVWFIDQTISNFLPTDDCIYLFFVCTDKASGAWPENKGKCTKMFNTCQAKLGLNVTADPDSLNAIEIPTDLSSGDGSSAAGNEDETTEAATEAQVSSYL